MISPVQESPSRTPNDTRAKTKFSVLRDIVYFLGPCLLQNLFHFLKRQDFPDGFDLAVDRQRRRHHYAELHNLIDFRNFLELVLDTEFLGRPFLPFADNLF